MADEKLTFVVEAKDLASATTHKVTGEVKGLGGTVHAMSGALRDSVISGNLMEDAAQRLGAGLRDAVGEAVDFQRQMLNVNSINKLGTDAFAEQAKQVSELSDTLPQSASVLAEGLYNIASSGFRGADGMEVLEASAKAASAGLASTDDAARGVTAVLNAYGLQADDATRISDIMFKTVDLGVVSFSELANDIGKTTALSAPLGVSFEEVSGALALMTTKGINAADATTQLNAIMTNLLKPSAQAQKLAKQLGLGWDSQSLKAKGLSGVMADLIEKTHGNHQQMATLLGDQRAIRGAFVLATDGGKQFNDEIAAMKDAAGATDSALSVQSQGLGYQLEILHNKFQGVVDDILIDVAPALSDLIGVVGGTTDVLIPLVEKVLPLFVAYVGVKAVLALKNWVTSMNEAKAASLAWSGIIGVGLAVGQQAAQDIHNNMLAQIQHAIATRDGTAALNAFNQALEESGGDVGKAKEALDHFLTTQKALLNTTTALHKGFEAKWKRFPELVTGPLRQAAPEITSAADTSITQPITHAMRYTQDEVKRLAAETPTKIAAAIISGKVDIGAIRKRMREIIKNPVSDARAEAQNAALLLEPGLASALRRRGHREMTASLLAEVVEPTLNSIKNLNARAFEGGKHLPPALARAIKQSGPSVVQAMRNLVQDQKAPLGALARIAHQMGLDGIESLIRGMIAKKQAARHTAYTITDDVRSALKFDAYTAGSSVVSSWVSGMVDELIKQIPTVNNAAHRFAGASLGTSLPKSGPFSAGPLKHAATSIAGFYVGAMADEITGQRSTLQQALGGLPAPGMTTVTAPAGGGTAYGLPARAQQPLEPHFHFHSAVPYTPAQGRAVASQIGPELVRWMRQNG